MTRVKKLIALAGVWAVLSSGVGCGLCDCLTGGDDSGHTASYSRDMTPPMTQQMPQQMPQARQPADITTGANVASAPGIYPDARK